MLERLAPTNEDVDYLNAFITNLFPGEVKVYQYLDSLNISGIPSHELKLKINQPIILLRNICPQYLSVMAVDLF